MSEQLPTLSGLGLICARTKHLANRDTVRIGEPCDCQPCRADRELKRLRDENRRLMEQLSEAAFREGRYVTLQEFMSQRNGGEDEQ